jgi:hypothetical protein
MADLSNQIKIKLGTVNWNIPKIFNENQKTEIGIDK